MDSQDIKALIEQHLPDAQADVSSMDNVHFEARIISAAFAGKRLLARHRLVHEALDGYLGDAIHALSLKALLTPDEVQKRTARDNT